MTFTAGNWQTARELFMTIAKLLDVQMHAISQYSIDCECHRMAAECNGRDASPYLTIYSQVIRHVKLI